MKKAYPVALATKNSDVSTKLRFRSALKSGEKLANRGFAAVETYMAGAFRSLRLQSARTYTTRMTGTDLRQPSPS